MNGGGAGSTAGRSLALRGPRALILGYFVVLLIILAATLPALLATIRALDRQQQRFDPAAAAADDLLSGALNQETGVRGYILTQKAAFLGPYYDGAITYNRAMEWLKEHPLSSDITPLVGKTDVAFRQWQQFAATSVAEVRSGNVRSASTAELSNEGKQLFDQFRSQQHTLELAVSARVRASRRSLRNEVERALVGLLIAAAVGFALATGLWLWWRVWGRRSALSEQRLADNAVLLQSVIDATNDPIFAKDQQGKHILANRARVASLARGNADTDLIGRSVDEFVDTDLAEQIRRDETQIMATGAEVRLEEALQQPDGSHIFLTTKSPLRDASGRVAGVVGVARDITEDRALLADRERLYQIEHRLATTLQQAMLGNDSIEDERIAVCARYQPAIEELAVGGDWYDVLPLPEQMVGLVVGDAVGRGIDAATAMGQLRSALSALAFAGRDPAATLEGLETFARTIPGARSATCAYVIIDPEHEVLTFSCAGHMPPLLLSPDDKPVYLEDLQDPPLAATTDARARRTGTRTFPVGSTLLLFTDALIERRSEAIDVGLERLAAVVVREIGQPVDVLCDGVLDELIADTSQRDDVAVVGARLISTFSANYDITIPADIVAARRARRSFETWLKPTMADDQARAEVVLAVGEAVTNSIEHAYGGGPNRRVRIRATRDAEQLRVQVDDYGSWKPIVHDPSRGRGLSLMRELMDDVDVSTGPEGTTVTLELNLASRRDGMTDELLEIRSQDFEGNVVVLYLRGELDLGNAAQLEQSLAEALSTARAAIMEINDLQYMDSSGFRTLHRAAEDNTILMVISAKAVLARAVRLSGLDSLIDFYDNLDAARIVATPSSRSAEIPGTECSFGSPPLRYRSSRAVRSRARIPKGSGAPYRAPPA